MKVKAIYSHTSGVEYVKDSYSTLHKKKGSNSGKVRILMLLKREEYNLDFNLLKKIIKRDLNIFVGYTQLLEYENCKYNLNATQAGAVAKVLGLTVEELNIIEEY